MSNIAAIAKMTSHLHNIVSLSENRLINDIQKVYPTERDAHLGTLVHARIPKPSIRCDEQIANQL